MMSDPGSITLAIFYLTLALIGVGFSFLYLADRMDRRRKDGNHS